MSYRILSDRLIIRPFVIEDITEEYLNWLNDRKLMKYSRQRFYTHTRESCEEYLSGFALSSNFFWNVSAREDGRQLGTLTAYVDPASATADVGLMIGYPGVGYGSEAFGLVLAYLFASFRLRFGGIQEVTVGTLSINEAMVRIASRWGMRLERSGKGQEGVVHHYAILRKEWMALNQRDQLIVEVAP